MTISHVVLKGENGFQPFYSHYKMVFGVTIPVIAYLFFHLVSNFPKEICDPDWVYYQGFCYRKASSCETWTIASSICLNDSSNLVAIESAEEDVFVQHLHHGRPSWIGLNDQANEGVYLWTDGGPVLYTHWAPGISAPYSEGEDCVESSGRDMKYHWQPSSCSNCRDFTCKKGTTKCHIFTACTLFCDIQMF